MVWHVHRRTISNPRSKSPHILLYIQGHNLNLPVLFAGFRFSLIVLSHQLNVMARVQLSNSYYNKNKWMTTNITTLHYSKYFIWLSILQYCITRSISPSLHSFSTSGNHLSHQTPYAHLNGSSVPGLAPWLSIIWSNLSSVRSGRLKWQKGVL